MSYYDNFSLSDLVKARADVEANLAKLGQEFDSLSGDEYRSDGFDGILNSKEQAGVEIYQAYSELGAINEQINQLIHAT